MTQIPARKNRREPMLLFLLAGALLFAGLALYLAGMRLEKRAEAIRERSGVTPSRRVDRETPSPKPH